MTKCTLSSVGEMTQACVTGGSDFKAFKIAPFLPSFHQEIV